MVYNWFVLKLSIVVSLLDMVKQDQYLAQVIKLSEYNPRFTVR